MSKPKHIGIIGGGPAGLKAAETAIQAGAKVTLYEAKRSVGRKFLIAGKSGLNLTSDAPPDEFIKAYRGPSQLVKQRWASLLEDYDNSATRAWAHQLGIDTFVSSGKKVFPEQMKAAPLLRRWVQALKHAGVQFITQQKLEAISPGSQPTLHFAATTNGQEFVHDHVILALGGGSWPISGSDGKWVPLLEQLAIKVHPLSSANCGWEVSWPSAFLKQAEGLPIKNISIHCGAASQQGEIVITRYGIEGGPVYRLGPEIRQNKKIELDLKPTFSEHQLIAKMESAKRNLLQEAARRWKLPAAVESLLRHYHHAENLTTEELASLAKACPIDCVAPRPIAEAISSAGGVCWSELDTYLRLTKHPNISIAGEMIDWEAPTGGFLLQGCFATGHRAALGALGQQHPI